ncbi:MAG TPA: DUF3536 domain-containing protein [Anaerolineaceae bacterium]|nr:DUF3536 domain-containing protein [Anaerolineaceae bacterium]HOQ68326.1 DUF3536 domain-containing protein [Anaerolineaceae bacterium]HOS53177.1 DUF3536 domain-containing protein [Anaerolineaceae bacterium]HQF68979.1 DUF3536 domain-containing protein [Anaerolineaceae bacterium]HQK05833.1 DUF3536 domain-containing protein [Anaerolineaceae bacterium]
MPENRAFCIHAHFYQPPREDPFTGKIPEEAGAAPFANWNERILATCYQPNVEERNFSQLSFNLGPTLVEWMSQHAPDVLDRIVQEDALNATLYGTGNAIAQPYHHTILPLASNEDKRTQVLWGIAAFNHVFGRAPLGMWLPETAVDYESLRVLASAGIQFTMLAPWQVEVIEGESPYLVELGAGKSIIVFVYHGGLSSTVSFDAFATSNADAFAEFYLKPEIDRFNPNQFLLIATDGELYGHHQPYREKFLSRLLDGSSNGIGLRATYPALWMKNHQVTGRARIVENTSWSCFHGIDRWRTECDCTAGSTWKAGLREGLSLIAARIDDAFSEICAAHGLDPITARNDYIQVMLGMDTFEQWLSKTSGKEVSSIGKRKLATLFSAQRLRQQMFSSCGWFFDELARIEPRNNLAYAAHAVVLMESLTSMDFHSVAQPALREAVSHTSGETAFDFFIFAYQRFKNLQKTAQANVG